MKTAAWDKSFFVILGGDCNLSCRHCYNQADSFKRDASGQGGFIEVERLGPLFAALAAQGYAKVFLSGGEPLLHEDIIGVVEAVTRHRLKAAMFSNGELLDEVRIAALAQAGLGELRISLNELCWATSTRARDSVLERKTRWVPALIRNGIGVGFVFIISALNIDDAGTILHRLRALGAGVKLQPLFLPPSLARSRAACSAIPADRWEHLLAYLQMLCVKTDLADENRRFPVYGNPWKLVRYTRFLIDYYVHGRRPDFCPTGPLLVVGPDGVIHPCLFRFDLSLGHLDRADELPGLGRALDTHRFLCEAPCFEEACLSAYR